MADNDLMARAGAASNDTTDQAQRAVKAFRTMLPTLSAYARALTGRPEVRVQMQPGNNGSTDGTTIFYRPPLALGDQTPHVRRDCDKRGSTGIMRCRACAVREQVLRSIYHEIAHICFASFATASEADRTRAINFAAKEAGGKWAEEIRDRLKAAPRSVTKDYPSLVRIINEYMPMLFNCLEDARVNLSLFEARQGMRVMFQADTQRVFEEGYEVQTADGHEIRSWQDAPLNSQIMVGCLVKASGFNYQTWFHPAVVEALNDSQLGELTDQVRTLKSASAVYNLTFKVLARLRDLGFCGTPDDPDPEPEENDDEDESDDESDDPSQGESDSDPVPPEDSQGGEDEDRSSPTEDAKSGDEGDGSSSSDDASDATDEADASGSSEGSGEVDGEPGAEQGSAESGPDQEAESGDGGDGGEAPSGEESPGGSGSPGGGEPSDDESDRSDSDDLGDGDGSGDGDTESGDLPDDGAGGSGRPDSDDDELPADDDSEGRPGESGSGDSDPSDAGSDSERAEDTSDSGSGGGAGGEDQSEPEPGHNEDADDRGTDLDPSGRDEESDHREASEEAGVDDSDGDSGSHEGGDVDEQGGSESGGMGEDHGDEHSEGESESGSSGESGDGTDRGPGLPGRGAESESAGDAADPSGEQSGQSDRPEPSDLPAGDDSSQGSDAGTDLGDEEPEAPGSHEPDDGGPDDRTGESGEGSERGDSPDPDGSDSDDVLDERGPVDAGDLSDDEGEPVVLPDFGSPEDVHVIAEEWMGHESPDDAQAQIENDAVDRAIIQGVYFARPSVNVFGVREHRYGESTIVDNVDYTLGWDASRLVRSNKKAARKGLEATDGVPESILQPALGKMRAAFTENARGAKEVNLKSGRINTKALGKRAGVGDPRVFRKDTLPGRREYHVVIGMDISGSTTGVNIVLEKRAVAAQAELLHRMGIGFSIYAHTGYPHDHREFEKAKSDPWNSRTSFANDLDIYHIKGPDETWSAKTKQRLDEIGPVAWNLDGHAMEYLRKRLDERPESDKILMYYSDGAMPLENYDEELAILTDEIAICRRKGYVLLGVGINTDSPTKHGLDTVEVNGDEDIAKVVKHLGKRIKK